MRLSILSLGVSLLALPAALAQAPPPAPVPYPLNVKPSTPQATLTGVPAQPATPQTFYVEGQGGLRIYMPPAPPILPPAQSYPTGTTMPWMAVVASTKPKTRVFEVADLVHAPLQIPGAAALEKSLDAGSAIERAWISPRGFALTQGKLNQRCVTSIGHVESTSR